MNDGAESLGRRLAAVRALADEQAVDDGLWFVAETAAEAYLQQELRRLHTVIEVKLDATALKQASLGAGRALKWMDDLAWIERMARRIHGELIEERQGNKRLRNREMQFAVLEAAEGGSLPSMNDLSVRAREIYCERHGTRFAPAPSVFRATAKGLPAALDVQEVRSDWGTVTRLRIAGLTPVGGVMLGGFRNQLDNSGSLDDG